MCLGWLDGSGTQHMARLTVKARKIEVLHVLSGVNNIEWAGTNDVCNERGLKKYVQGCKYTIGKGICKYGKTLQTSFEHVSLCLTNTY